MGCVYIDHCGKCSLYDKEDHEDKNYKNSEFGFSEEVDGACAVEEDPRPSDNCSMYESNGFSDEDDEDDEDDS